VEEPSSRRHSASPSTRSSSSPSSYAAEPYPC
jgi:hypothetical protein